MCKLQKVQCAKLCAEYRFHNSVYSSQSSVGPASKALSSSDSRRTTVKNKTFHTSCLTCCECHVLLGKYFEKDGRMYCVEDYHKKFSPKCHKCDKVITDRRTTVKNKTFHASCFKCCECHVLLGEHFEKDGRMYCVEDYHKKFSPKCYNCDKVITDSRTTAKNKNFHTSCFKCCECHVLLGKHFERDDRLYCGEDYHKKFSPKCHGCQQVITSAHTIALGNPWHRECFVCQSCGVSFNGGPFFHHDDIPFCKQHYIESSQ
uniref:LIM zinc-binding domain-containing protein n=1 Tax=Caenorhabditis japonica TaxID=281687 RepID=A0A8R1DWH5_CAEJA